MEETGRGHTRRQALGGLMGGAAGLTLSALPAEAHTLLRSSRSGPASADVVIVGGGISGLTAAYRLVRGTALSVLVLEANDRVGGRTENLPLPGSPGKITEGGGQWTGPGQDRVQALARELGITTFKTFTDGESVYLYKGRRRTFTGVIPPIGPAALADLAQAQIRLERMASTVPLEAPWSAARAAKWDAMTLGEWIDQNMATAQAKLLLTVAFSITNSQDPHDFSFLFALFALHSWGGLSSMIDGAQEYRFTGGSQEISLQLAHRLGARVRLNTPVDHIDQTAGDVVVVHSGAACYTARQVIVAMTPQDANRIRYAPTLTTQRIMVQKCWSAGTGWKTFAVYDKPFWREQGLSGQGLSDNPAAAYTSDNSPPDGSPGVLLSFFGTAGGPGPGATPPILRNNKAARRTAVLQALAELFGEQALHPVAYLEKDWIREPYIAGCESPRPPGLLTQYTSAVSDPVGRIHWAGTETSPMWEGYMDGAVRAGERAAEEVTAALGGNPGVIPA
jgi:monoamine oxidase